MTQSTAMPAIEICDVTYAYHTPWSKARQASSEYASGRGPDDRGQQVLGTPATVLQSITLNVSQGERLGILGPNGGGKSTLLKLILGLLSLDGSPTRHGEIRVLGMTPNAARRKRVIGYVPQKVEAEMAFPISARGVVELAIVQGVPFWKRVPQASRYLVSNALDVVGASAYADKPIGTLSGGQVQRVMVARALACTPRILLLDEPMVGIDPAGQRQFAELIDRVNKTTGVTVIVVSHDIRTVVAGCDRIACLSRTLHSHTSAQGLTPGVLAEVFRHDVSAIFGDVHVDAHAAAACKDPSHAHEHSHAHAYAETCPVAQLEISPGLGQTRGREVGSSGGQSNSGAP